MIEYADVTRLHKNMQRAADYAPQIVDSWLHKMVGPALVNEMKLAAPVAKGLLRDSIRQINSPRSVSVGPFGVPYNRFVVEGTKPHVIYPAKGQYLVFRVNGQTIYAKKVNHPGTKPNPYMNTAAERVMKRLTPQITKLTIEVLRTGDV